MSFLRMFLHALTFVEIADEDEDSPAPVAEDAVTTKVLLVFVVENEEVEG